MLPSKSLAGRALVAVGLMIGFYVLALGLAALLLFVSYAILKSSGGHYGQTIRLVFFCMTGAGMILWSLVPRPDRFVPPGPRLDPSRQRRLFQVLDGIATAVKQEVPADVYLIPDVNAWVAQRGGVMGFGSRRVMGLGLPLLQIVTVSQLRAVLTHEFGHYEAGDTKLGPWVYKTRAAIARTIQNLAKGNSLLANLFLWYWKVFLRITQAISRRQEFTADALAARVAGAGALVQGLRAIHGAAPAFASYWSSEAAPVLNAGFLPPLAEGFGRFVAAPAVAEAISRGVDQEILEAKSNPYDSHPPLRDRIKTVTGLPQGKPAENEPPSLSLLDDVNRLELELLTVLNPKGKFATFKPATWENVGETVYTPMWRDYVREYAALLGGITLGSLSESCKDLKGLGDRIRDPKGMLLTREQRARRAGSLLGAALALTLKKNGWTLYASPGELYLGRGQTKINPFEVVNLSAAGKLKPEAWRGQFEAEGILDLSLAETP